jgi:hypothetical protein
VPQSCKEIYEIVFSLSISFKHRKTVKKLPVVFFSREKNKNAKEDFENVKIDLFFQIETPS